MGKTDKTYIAWGLDDGGHEARNLKPMLTPEMQVELLKAKGVTFERCTEAEAIAALTERDKGDRRAIFKLEGLLQKVRGAERFRVVSRLSGAAH